MGYLRGVVHGAIIGGAIALLYAPKPGRQMREELSERLDQVRGQMQPAQRFIADLALPAQQRAATAGAQYLLGGP